MNLYHLLDKVWQHGVVCETCPYMKMNHERYEVWGSDVSEEKNVCRVIEEDMDPNECPGLEAAKERAEEDERLYG